MNTISKILRKIKNAVLPKIRKLRLNNSNFTIISNNCWGGFIYQYYKIPYLSPFIGLFVFAPDYIKLIENLKTYLNYQLDFIDPQQSKYKDELIKYKTLNTYPIGVINDVELHFLHFKTEEDAREKWERRIRRINWDNLVFKFCDRDLATSELITRFDSLHYRNKICLTAKEYKLDSCLRLKNEHGSIVENEWDNFRKTINVTKIINKLTGSP